MKKNETEHVEEYLADIELPNWKNGQTPLNETNMHKINNEIRTKYDDAELNVEDKTITFKSDKQNRKVIDLKSVIPAIPEGSLSIEQVNNVDTIPDISNQLVKNVEVEAGQINNKLSSSQMSIIKNRIPLVSFSDDDGNKAILEKLKPISIKKEIPFSIALIIDYSLDGRHIDLEDALKLQNELGWEILSHTWSDVPLGDENLTDAELVYQIRDSLVYLREHGFHTCKNFVYPGGQASSRAIEYISKYCNVALGTGTADNTYPLNTFNLNRQPFPANAPNNTLDYYKGMVDDAFEKKQWLIWMLHCGEVKLDIEQLAILESLIDYIKTKEMPITTIQDGINLVGNIIDINDKKFYMSCDGTNNIVNTQFATFENLTGQDIILSSHKPSFFENEKEVISLVNTDRANFPTNSGGTLVTRSLQMNYVSQEFSSRNNHKFMRYSIDSDTWTGWVQITDCFKTGSELITTSIPANGTITHQILTESYDKTLFALLNATNLTDNRLNIIHYYAAQSGSIVVKFINTSGDIIELTNAEFSYALISCI